MTLGSLFGATTLAVALAGGSAVAGTHTWTGSVSSSWSNPANWLGGAPQPGEPGLALDFPSGAARTTSTNDVTGLEVESILLHAGGYSIGGQAITLSAGILMDEVLTSPGGTSISLPILLSQPQTLQGGGYGNGRLSLTGVLSGGPSADVTFKGTLSIYGTNTYLGKTVISEASIDLGNDAAFGSPSAGTTLEGYRIFLNSSVSSIAEPLELVHGSQIEVLGGSPITFSGAITLTGAGPEIFLADDIGQITISGPITGTGGLVYDGRGTMTITGPGSWSGTTAFKGGKVILNGSLPPGDVVLTNWQTPTTVLAGTGTAQGNVTLQAGGRIAPGEGAGTLAVSGNVSFLGAKSGLDLELSALDAYDRLTVGGNLDLTNAELLVRRGFGPPLGSVFTFLTWGGTRTGTFKDLPEGATVDVVGQDFQVHYGPQEATLTATSAPPADSVPWFVPAAQVYGSGGRTFTYGLGSVGDVETPAGSLSVSVVSTPAGVSLSDVTNAGGVVSAAITTACGTPVGNGVLVLQVSDGSNAPTATVPIYVQGDGSQPSVYLSGSTTVFLRQTTCAPTPGMTLAQLQAEDPALFAAWLAFLATIQVSDNCTSQPTFLGLRYLGADLTDATPLAAGQGHAITARYSDDAGNIGSATFTIFVVLAGDVTRDTKLDVFDLVALAAKIVGNVQPGTSPHLASAGVGDVNGDGTVDVFDLVTLSAAIVGNVSCLAP